MGTRASSKSELMITAPGSEEYSVLIKVNEKGLNTDHSMFFIRMILVATLVLLIDDLIQTHSHSNNAAFACECLQPKPPIQALNESKAVFSGTVTAIKSGDSGKTATIDVERAWKGISNDTVTVITGLGDADCGFPFQEGKEYLVYSHDVEGPLYASACSRTTPLSEAQEDLKVLGVGYVPIQDTSGPNSGGINNSFPFIVGIGAVIAGTIAYFMLRKRK